MKTNIEFFNYSKDNPEDILDPFYAKNMVVIPSKKEEVKIFLLDFSQFHARFHVLC